MTSLRAFRALARVERREIVRHARRSLLIALLVAAPVAAIVGGGAFVRITEPTPGERRVHAMGRAELRIESSGEFERLDRIRALVPNDAPVTTMFLGTEEVAVPGRRVRARCIAIDPSALAPGGIASGVVSLIEGRAPWNAGEVAISEILSQGLDVGIGDQLTLSYGPRRRLTGIVQDSEDLTAAIALRTPAAAELGGTHVTLVGGLGGRDEALVTALRDDGFAIMTRDEAGAADALLSSIVFALGGVGFLEAGLVIAAAFAVGLRRRQREVGLLGAVGASIAGIRTAIVVSSVAMASVGALGGAIVGWSAIAVLMPYLDGWNGRVNGSFETAWIFAIVAAVLGITAAGLASALPARAAARVPIRVALSGRRPVADRSTTWLAAGLGMIAVGVALLLFVPRNDVATGALGLVVGPVLGVLGFGACSPWFLDALARRSSRLPLAWRLAARDAGRFRARNGPVVTAVLAGMSMSVTVAILVASLEHSLDAMPPELRDDQLLVDGPDAASVAARLETEFGVIASAPIEALYSGGEPVRARYTNDAGAVPPRGWVACGDARLLLALGAVDGEGPLSSGRLLALDPPRNGGAIALTTWRAGRALPPLASESIALDRPIAAPRFVIERSRAESLGWTTGPPLDRSLVPWVVRLEHPVTGEALERAREIAASSAGASVDAARLHQRPGRTFYRFVLVACMFAGCVVVLVATSLNAVESAADTRVLRAVGAAPRVLRGFAAARAGYVAALGCALAVPAGVLPAVALFTSVNVPFEFVVPWRDLAVIAFALPAAVYGWVWIRSETAVERASMRSAS